MTSSIEDIIRRIVREELERALPAQKMPVHDEKPAALIAGRRRMLTIDQVSELTGITKKAIYQLRCQTRPGSFAPAMKVGGRLVWDPDELDAWLVTKRV